MPHELPPLQDPVGALAGHGRLDTLLQPVDDLAVEAPALALRGLDEAHPKLFGHAEQKAVDPFPGQTAGRVADPISHGNRRRYRGENDEGPPGGGPSKRAVVSGATASP